MDAAQHLICVVNGKTVYLIKTADMLNSKLNQVIHSLLDDRSLPGLEYSLC